MPATYNTIATTTLTGSTATVTFSSIPSTYTDLIIVANVIQAAGNNSIRYRFNNDSGANYSTTYLLGNGSTATSGRDTSMSSAYEITTGSTTLETLYIIQVMNYSNTTTNKTSISRGNRASAEVSSTVSLWQSTAAIDRIDIAMGGSFPTNNMAANTTISIYGIKAA